MRKLSELSVLAIDCQATHSHPSSGHLVEIGWMRTQAVTPFDHEMAVETAKSYLVKMDKNVQIPRQFLVLTGIELEEMKGAFSRKNIWNRLRREAERIFSANQGICPAVIHFKRYEEPYLMDLHHEFAPKEEFPFGVICTHEVVRRLYPGLPRKGLRAAAGFFGFSLPQSRRSLHHVVATAFIWGHLVRILEEQKRIATFDELQDWLRHPPSSFLAKQRAREYPMEKVFRQNLPDKPGIYRMYRLNGDLLYIGKAKSLKNRISSYFRQKGRHAEHILEMLSQARKLSTAVTDTVLEAAVRESDEIKLYSPPYNRALLPKERYLLFYSKDLRSKQSEPTLQHPLGPFPSNFDLESLAKFQDVLNGRIQNFSPRLIQTLLDTPFGYAPEKDCFEQGLRDFRKEYTDTIQTPVGLGHFMKWGTLFWLEKLAEKEQERGKEPGQDGEIFQEDEAQESNAEEWTPERVFKALKRKIRLGSFQMRRARWFCRLSESMLTWSNGKGSEKHVLLIERGNPIFKGRNLDLDGGCFRAGSKKNMIERQANFDIATLDRMRIVTTEIRRLVQEDRDIELCFHPGKVLQKEQLRKMLKWI